MSKIKKKWDLLSERQRAICIEEVIRFFENEQDVRMGVIAAEEILDFFLQTLAIEIYRKGVEDSKDLLKNRLEDLEVDLTMLQEV